MRVHIAAVGKLKSGPEHDLFQRYCERISQGGKQLHLFGPTIIEVNETKAASREERTEREAQQLLSKLPGNADIILMDETGKDLSSVDLSTFLQIEQNAGTSDLVFAIGGADGHGQALRDRAKRTIRFGTQTWPHQLVRIMLAEQLYRAITILSGHPYHRS